MSNRVKHRPGWAALALAAAALSSGAFWSGAAHAQRGEAYTLNEPLRLRSGPDDGFPGSFDTQLVQKGAVVANLPSSSLYYGVTDDLSVGTVVLSYLPWLSGLPCGSLYARYRLGSTSWFRSTADVGLFAGEGPESSFIGAAVLSSNTEFALTHSQSLAFNALYARADLRLGEGSANLDLLLLGGTYSLVLADWAALHLTGLYVTSGSLSVDDDSSAVDADFSGIGSVGDRIIVRGTLGLRAGSWLFDVGAVRLGGIVLPWLGVAFQVGG